MDVPSDQFRPLPIRRAFVVQLHAEADVAHGRIMGRVEHVVSGQATRFHTLDELVRFFASVLHADPTESKKET
jgi:hypothetical protein